MGGTDSGPGGAWGEQIHSETSSKFRGFAAAITAALITLGVASLPDVELSSAATPTSTTLNPVADAYVNSGRPTTNFGGAATLRVDGSPVERGYLRFSVPALNGSITKATLRLYVNNGSSSGYSVRPVSDNAWTESAITYNNAPAFGAVAASSGTVSGGWKDIDVTSLFTGSGLRSLALTTGGSSEISVVSRNGTSARIPQLIVEALDSIAPAVTLTWPANGATVGGPTPTFIGNAGTAAGDSSQVTVKVYSGTSATGTPVQTRTTTASGSSWSVQASPALSAGTYTAQAEQSDSSGNIGRSQTSTFTVPDTTPPAVTLTTPASGATTGLTPTFSGAAGTASGDSSQVEVKVYSGSSATGTPVQSLNTTASGNSWSTTASPALAEGTYTVQAEQSDSAGNTGKSQARTFTAQAADTTPPAVTLTAPSDGATTGLTPNFAGAAGTVSDDSNQITVKVYSGSSATGTPVQTLNTTASGNAWSTTASPALAEGTYTVQAEQSDSAGNTGRSQPHTFAAQAPDTTAPSVTLTAPADGATTGLAPTFSGAAGTASGDSSQVTVKVYAGSSATGTPVQTLTATASGGSWSVQASPALSAGNYAARAEQSDAAGNTGQSAVHTFIAVNPNSTGYRDQVLSDGPRGYWRLGESSGTVAVNEVPGPTGEYRGGVALGQPGAPSTDPNTSAGFDGADDTIKIADAPALDPTSALTLEAWVNPPATSSAATVLRKEGQYMLRVQAGGAVTFRIWQGGVVKEFTTASGVLDPGGWNQLDATWDGSTMQVFVNGVSRGTMALAGSADTTTQALYVASTYQSYDWFKGRVDEVAVYDRALSAGRIQAHYAAAAPLDTSSPAVALLAPTNGSAVDPSPTFGGTAGTSPGDSDQVTVKVYAGSSATGTPVQTIATTASSGSWSVQTYTPLDPGTYTGQAEQSDAAGNTGRSQTTTFTVRAPDPASYRSVVTSDAPRAYWRLGETSGTVAANEIGAPTGEYRGGVALGQGGALSTESNPAASFDGADDTVRIVDGSPIDPTAAFTIEAWIRPASGAPTATILRKDGQYMVRRGADGSIIFRVWKGAAAREFTTAAGVAPADVWNQVVLTFDGSKLETWVNGTSRGSMALAGPIDSTTNPLYLASTYQSYDWFKGRIDEVSLYGSALSATRISAHYTAAAPIDTVPPALNLLSPTSGSTMDQTPNFGGAPGVATGDANLVAVKVYAGSTATGTPVRTLTTVPGPGSYSIVAAPALAPGTYTAQAEQSDNAGNTGRSAPTTFTVQSGDPTLLAAGDISGCDTFGDEATAAVLDRLPGTLATLGDHAYEDGTPEQFANCYGPTWGRHKARTRPTIGGHDYRTPGAAGYFGYFGAAAGDPSKGYYSYDLGQWHVIAINSVCSQNGGCWYDDPEEQWIRQDLAAHPSACTVALEYEPRFSSGSIHASEGIEQEPFWQALYDNGVDVVLSADEHVYERFAPQTPQGAADPTNGIRQFTVGTGGRSHYAWGTILPNSQVRNNDSFGILKLTLHPTSYAWEFVAQAGSSFTDTGSAACH